MRMDPDWDRRLDNWARWCNRRDGGGRYGVLTMEARVDGQGHDAPTVIPTSDGEAEETHVGVSALEGVLRAAVEIWYRGTGSIAEKTKRMCCSETTLRARIGLAHARLGEWRSDKHAAAERRRADLERLQRGALLLRRGV